MTRECARKEVVESVDQDEIIELARELIRIPSHASCSHREREIAHFLKEYFEGSGCEVHLQEVCENRLNVVCILRGKGKAQSLMLNGHLDTVPPGRMESAFVPRIVGDRLYGRGSADMKGGLAAMAGAVKTIAAQDISLDADLMFVGTAGEETGNIGMEFFITEEAAHPDFCIIGEPTSLNIGLGHKGFECLRIETRGRAAHGSTPKRGVSAISHMVRVLLALEEELIPMLEGRRHEILGNATVNIGTIRGGDAPNVVPETCTVQMDRRWLPDESLESVREEVEAILGKLATKIPGLQATVFRDEEFSQTYHGPVETPGDHVLVGTLRSTALTWAGKRSELVGLHYGTDGGLTHKAGITTVICGPGCADQAHTDDEHVSLKELVSASRMYCETALAICCLDKGRVRDGSDR